MIFSKIHQFLGIVVEWTGNHAVDTDYDSHNERSSFYVLIETLRMNSFRKIQDEGQNEVVITLDAGDWFSGSMYDRFESVCKVLTPQLDYFEMAGYDAVTLGNHEVRCR